MIENTEELLGQIVPSGSVVGAMLTEKGDKGDKGDTGETGSDGFSPIITTSKQGKVTTLTIVDAEGTKTATINDGADGSGSGDMLKSTYDTNENGIVDNAEKVNNHTVDSNVPANAVFTDTTYTAGTGIEITAGNVINNTQTSAEWGNISGDITDQSDLQSALSDKVDTSDLASVATSGNYNDLTNKPTIPTVNNATLTIQKNSTTLDTFTANASVDKTVNISVPTKVSDLSNDSGFITNSVNNLTNYTTTSTLNTLLAGKEKDIPIQNTAPQNPEEDDLWIDTSEEGFDNSNVVNQYSESTTDVYSCSYVNGKVNKIPKNTCIVSKSGITSATLTSSNGYGRVWVLSGVSLTIVSFNGDNETPTITDVWGTHSFTASINGKVITLSSLANWDHYIFMGTDVITSIE